MLFYDAFLGPGYNSREQGGRSMNKKHLLRALTLVSTLGLTVISTIAVGIFLGSLVDRWLNSSPWGTIVGIILGMLSGLYGIFKLVMDQDH
jgi:ATP synthase protein I